MAQQHRVTGRATAIFTDGQGDTKVIYQGTPVVTFNAKAVTLKSNGWNTQTTKNRMNQASNQFHLRFCVFQRGFAWYVILPTGAEVPFQDGMTFDRNGLVD